MGATADEFRLYRAAGPDLVGELRGPILRAQFSVRADAQGPLGNAGLAAGDHQPDGLFLQFPRGGCRQLHRHRPHRLGQDRRPLLPARPGHAHPAAPALRLFRQGSRRRDFCPRHGRTLRAAIAGRTDRLRAVAARRHARQPKLRQDAGLVPRHALGPSAECRGNGCDLRRGRQHLYRFRAAAAPA